MPREQGESGEFVETLAPEDVLDVFDAVDGPVILSADVADHFGVTRETARRKLKQLFDRGELDRRKVSRRVIYWRADHDTERTPKPTGAGDATQNTAGNRNAESDAGDPVGDALDGWGPDTEANAETARSQTRRTAAYLRDHAPERFTRSDLVDALADGSTLGGRSWWERAVQPGLRELADADLVEYRRGHHDYRWTGGVVGA